ncbi:uncharacterized protein CcaverHIS019_0109980 [Cutaneotrichosporon cavernicola]|uniref:ARM repeat-containing protein n=1 Tax=Cutaneotrichosporon cavernicola TaxID=279322 RepID=A0AA48L0I8_9TREE|nr:uncharacterized protein CcaverHIS019_0109980 [Cutaneotrichosporon cavernicola]BEI88280.1 hypothetical protein CcaverHIS019_0109980 [Cutaneotrichosporon cavernicola]
MFPPFNGGIWSPPQWSASSGDSNTGDNHAEILALRKHNQLLVAERDMAIQKIQQLTAMPLTTVDLIIKGKVDYLRMNKRSDFELVNCLVSTISQEQFNLNIPPKGLKEATITLGQKSLGQPKFAVYTQYLVKMITEQAKSLCLTSNGNHLCQQLLEKCDSEDKLNFIKQIEEDMFAIANDMFGVHVLVKAIGVRELEILEDLPRVATNEFGHYLIKRFLGLEPMFHAAIFTASMFNALAHSILTCYPPLATNYYGVRFVETVIDSNRLLQRANAIKYLNSLCSQKDGRIPAIVDVANSSVGRGHLQFVLRHMPRHGDGGLMSRVRSTCRQFQTTLRNSQSGNELLRRLGVINTPARRF